MRLTLFAIGSASLLACALLALANSPESELAAARRFAFANFRPEDIEYVRCFTTYAVPKELRKDCENALQFVLNSCASVTSSGKIYHARPVPGSETLWWIDIREFGWSIDQINDVFRLQPYFLAPLVEQPGDILFRADWFIAYATDNTLLNDRGVKDLPYYILLYGKGKEPKNADDFRKAWFVDIKTIREQGVERGTIIEAGDSGVSQRTRQLRRGRTVFGYYWETRDVKSHDVDPDKLESRDYIEDIFARFCDAGEYITSHRNGTQVYLLTAGNKDNFKRVEDGDAGVVVDRQDRRDPRVRTAKGCMVCHAMGIIPATNAIQEMFRAGIDLRFKSKELSLAVESFYLGHLNSLVEDDCRLFARAIKECNGLDPLANMQAYVKIYDWYMKKVPLAQAAIECGLNVPEYQKFIQVTPGGRLARLFKGSDMPRDIWDSLNGGGYIQSMALIRRVEPKKAVVVAKPVLVEVIFQAPLYGDNQNVLATLGVGTQVTLLRVFDANFYVVSHNGQTGYVQRNHTRGGP